MWGASGGGRGGFTLYEILLVVAILGIVALASIPSLTSRSEEELQLATAEIVEALRFARSESLRTQVPHGLDVGPGQERFRVFELDHPGSSLAEQSTVYHPLRKQPYDISFPDYPALAEAQIVSLNYAFSALCAPGTALVFDATGLPVCPNPTTALVSQWDVRISAGGMERTVAVAPGSGRVTVQ